MSSSFSGAPGGAASLDDPSLVDDRALRRKRKKELKNAKKGKLVKSTALGASDLDSLYADLKPSIELKLEKNRRQIESITTEDVQNLLLWVYTQATSPQWCFLKNKALIGNAVLLILREASHSQYTAGVVDAPFLRGLPQVKTSMPRGSHWNKHRRDLKDVDSSLLYISDSSSSKRKRVDGDGESKSPAENNSSSSSAADAASPAAERTPEQYAQAVYRMCLRHSELVANKFPMGSAAEEGAASSSSSSSSSDGNSALVLPPRHAITRSAATDLRLHHAMDRTDVTSGAGDSTIDLTPSAATAIVKPRLLALDCEMCQTALGLQLARVTVVDESEAVVLDLLVKPELPVMDHLTQYSGITAAMLATATATMTDVHAKLLEIVDGSGSDSSSSGSAGPAVLVGHSLECDLQALRLVHTRIIDTSLLFPHPAGLPYRHALRHLTKTRLGRVIQAGHGTTGHDSIEDTVAVLHLVQAALAEPPSSSHADESDDEGETIDVSGDAAMAAESSAATDSAEDGEHASSPPPAKRARAGVDDTAAAAQAAAPSIKKKKRRHPKHAFAHHFSKPGREHIIPPAAAAQASTSGAAATASSSIRGLAGTLSQLSGGSNSGSSGSGSGSRGGGGSVRQRSLLLHSGMGDKAVCGSMSLVGSPAFLRSHLCGPASGVSVPISSSLADTQRALSKVAQEAGRASSARKQGGVSGKEYVGPGLVVAELVVPRKKKGAQQHVSAEGSGDDDDFAATSSSDSDAIDWRGFDSALSSWSSALPQGTAVLAVMQARIGAGMDGSAGAAQLDASEAAWGHSFFWIAPHEGSSASTARDSLSSSASGAEGSSPAAGASSESAADQGADLRETSE